MAQHGKIIQFLANNRGLIRILVVCYKLNQRMFRIQNQSFLTTKHRWIHAVHIIHLHHILHNREEAYAIGDSTNDLPMFEAAGHTAALGDGMPELQAKAGYITAPVLENGLEQALKHWKLI